MELETLNLTSITGVVAATLTIVEILKRTFSKFSFWSRVPVFVYAIVISAICALLANRVFMIDGHPLLPGETWKVIWASVIAAAGASGFYTWLRNPESLQTAGRLGDGMKAMAILLVAGLSLGGCVNAEKSALRETLVQGTQTIRAEHKEWAGLLVRQPDGSDRRAELPQLSPSEYQNLLKLHDQFDANVANDRARDAKPFGTK